MGDEDDVGRLRKLFSVTQHLLIEQTTKAELLNDELTDMVKNEGKTDANKGL